MDLGRKILHAVLHDVFEKKLNINGLGAINTERMAIDQRGRLGSFYDGYTDNITGKLNIQIKSSLQHLTNQTKYVYIQDCKRDAPNLLRFVDIDHQLRLSILLRMTLPNGIASLVQYPRLIDKYTRFLYVYHESYSISYGDNVHELKSAVRKSTCDTFASHVITGLVCGVHALVILQLPPNQEKEIDDLLLTLYTRLINNKYADKLDCRERVLLNQILSTKVYSNFSELNEIRKFEDIYERITQLRENKDISQVLKYILTPISWFHGQHHSNIRGLAPCQPDAISLIEHYLLQQSFELKRLKFHINCDLADLLQGKLRKQLENIQNQLLILQVLHSNDIQEIGDLISKIRKGTEQYSTVNNTARIDPPKEIERLIKEINTRAEELTTKIKIIKRLQVDEIEYCDVGEFGIHEGIKEDVVRDVLLRNDFRKVIFLSNDTFRKQDPEKWTIIYSGMIEERKNNPTLQLVYADFTDSKYQLPSMDIIRLPQTLTNNNSLGAKSSQGSVKRRAPPPPVPSSFANEYINIVLLGESGVGKSTFINALANYLRFPSLDAAQQDEPTVIIPVSYVMTINDDFEERIIKFGDIDPNENHNDFGQTVTQQCKAYVFDISKEKKLRIIDTPGFGDTRGGGQDDLNMEAIFSFLTNFAYVNGICLLFKSEVVQLNPYIRSCCTQLFDYFGENIRDHFIFCFTNARATFFTPGNIRPLLNTFFESFPVKNIPFTKENTFCFDNESFRYLVAVRNEIEFEECKISRLKHKWEKSAMESQRFRDLLCKKEPYRKNEQWQSGKDAQFQIQFMIRPILEAMRNLLRNVIMHKSNSSIELFAVSAEPSLMLCCSCDHRIPEKFGQFWILPDHLHHSANTCSSNDQKPTEYRLSYQFLNDSDVASADELNAQLKCLYEACAKFTYFLMRILQTLVDDAFLNGIGRMVNEEEFIYHRQTPNDANGLLIDGLKQLKEKYEKHLKAIQSTDEHLTLPDVYNLIKSVGEISMIKTQLDAIKIYRQHLVNNIQSVVQIKEIGRK